MIINYKCSHLAHSYDLDDRQNFMDIVILCLFMRKTFKRKPEFLFFPEEQKGCKKGSYGWKDQFLINKMILENCKNPHRNLSTAWINYGKAFDNVRHDWTIKALQIEKISPKIIEFISECMHGRHPS